MSSSVESIAEWQNQVQALLPSLSRSEAKVLGWLSYGMVLLDGCGLTKLSQGLAQLEHVPAGRLRQRLREFYYEAEAKRGAKRREVEVQGCFGDLLAGVLRGWEGQKELALALDASTLGERFTVLNISVVYRGCAIPVAWRIIGAREEGGWREHWESLLANLAGVVPEDWKVIVMADRGLYAAWLYQAIVAQGWHPFLRVKENLHFRAAGEAGFSPIGKRVQRRGRGWKGKGQWSEQGERMEGTLLVRWEKGYEEKLAVVTDLEPEEAEVAWYQMRFWIEDEYKDHKSGGWGWQQTKMQDPKRAERLWLAMAVAMQWVVVVGGQEEASQAQQARRLAPKGKGKRRGGRPARSRYRPRGREQSCLRTGQQKIMAAVIRGEALPRGHVIAETWPKQTFALGQRASSWKHKCQRQEAHKRHRQRKQAQQAAVRREAKREQEEQKQQEREATRALRQRERAEREQERAERQQERAEWKLERAASRQHKQEEREQRKREQACKAQRRRLAREAREQERERRLLWHEQIQREREQRRLRQQERRASHASAPLADPPRPSTFCDSQTGLAPPPAPP